MTNDCNKIPLIFILELFKECHYKALRFQEAEKRP
jgi:hypothetical protein